MEKKFRLLLLLALLLTAATGAWAQSNTVTWNNYQLSEFNLSSQGDRETFDDVTITSNGGSVSDNAGSIYFNGGFTFSVPAGSVLTQIVIIDESWLSVEVDNTGWSLDEHQTGATWTGSARSVACQINAPHVQYIEFTIAPAVPKMYTSDVSITELLPGDTLAAGATIIGSGNDYDMVYIDAGRTKENGVVQSYWTNLHEPPTVIGPNGTISGTSTPVDENGQDGNAWVVTRAEINDDDGFEVGLDGITIRQLYTVTLDDGGKDTQNWTITPAEATTTGVTEGQTVTLQYNGRLKVKGVKATSDAEPAAVSLIVNPVVGQYIGSDGKNYDAYAILPTDVTAVAMIAYVGSDAETSTTYNHGLALALSDVSGNQTWCSQKSSTCLTTQYSSESAAKADMAGLANTDALVSNTDHTHTAASAARNYNSGTHPTGTSAWFLPSAGQWDKMATAAGGYGALRTNAGMQSGMFYWTSSEGNAGNAWNFSSGSGYWTGSPKSYNDYVRPCLAF